MTHLQSRNAAEYAQLIALQDELANQNTREAIADEEIQYRTVYDLSNEAEDLGIDLDE